MDQHETLLVTFIAVTALAVVTQGVAALVMAFAVLEIKKKIDQLLNETRAHLHPLLKSTNGLLEDVQPRLRTIGDNLVEVSESVKLQTAHIQTVLDDVLLRTHRQIVRADHITTSTFTAVENTRSKVESIVDTPLRIVTGIASGVSAAVDRLFNGRGDKTRSAQEDYAAGEPDLEEVVLIVEEPVDYSE